MSALGSPKVGGAVPRLGHNPKFVYFFLMTPPQTLLKMLHMTQNFMYVFLNEKTVK